ncbi:N-acetyltransferase [Actinomadura cremea]|nr:N-acetyltransferase [Actinomadura cremea]
MGSIGVSGPTLAAPRVSVRAAVPADVPVVAATMCEAFFGTPVTSWVFPDARQRAELLPAHYALIIRRFLECGEVRLVDEGAGACLYHPPGASRPSADGLLDALRPVIGDRADRSAQVFRILDAHHPDDRAHYHLAYIAVRPGRPASLGMGLMQALLDRADADGLGVYAECTSRDSRAGARIFGFVPLESFSLPDGPPIHPCWREPRPPRSRT